MANPLQMLNLSIKGFQHIEEVPVEASPERVWKAITSPEEWFGFDPDKNKWPKSSLKAKPGEQFAAKGANGTMMLHGTVTYVEPGKLLRISGSFGLTHLPVNSTFIFELQPQEDGTKTLLRLGRRTFGFIDDSVEERMKGGWQRLLGQIKAAAEASKGKGKKKKG